MQNNLIENTHKLESIGYFVLFLTLAVIFSLTNTSGERGASMFPSRGGNSVWKYLAIIRIYPSSDHFNSVSYILIVSTKAVEKNSLRSQEKKNTYTSRKTVSIFAI